MGAKVNKQITTIPDNSDWNPTPPKYITHISPDSPGWQTCELWREQLTPYVDLARKRSAIIFTGIGGAAAGQVTGNGVSRFGDGSLVYPEAPLPFDQHCGFPQVVFAVVSAINSDELVNFLTLAETYKDQGVQVIIPIFTGFPHERQDHQFTSTSGVQINQLTTLKGIVSVLAGAHRLGLIHGGIAIGNHSQRAAELALRYNFPLLLIDPFQFMVHGANLTTTINPIVIGPDKGRYNIAERLAAHLNCPVAYANKTRARLQFGDPTVVIPRPALDYIQNQTATVIMCDDEIREAGTVDRVRQNINGYAKEFRLAAFKAFMACCSNGQETAITRLTRQLTPGFQEQFFLANAVKPQLDTSPLNAITTWLDIRPEIIAMVKYLARNLDQPAGPNTDGTFPNTLLQTDLHSEDYS